METADELFDGSNAHLLESSEILFTTGHPDAVAAGCLCPVIDNGHGKGSGRVDLDGNPAYWFNVNCPYHVEQDEDDAQ